MMMIIRKVDGMMMQKKVIKYILVMGVVGVAFSTLQKIIKMIKEEQERLKNNLDKMHHFYLVMNDWLFLHHKNIKINQYFKENNYKRIAIYGYAELGQRLYEELKDCGENVVCIIDRDADRLYADEVTEVVTPDNITKEMDVIVVTAVSYFETIKSEMQKKVKCPIVSLDDVVLEVR